MSKSGTSELVREESESALIARAQTAVSKCNWEVGECAAIWTKRFARGRTDADFAMLVSLSADQVYQRRRVWETFADVYQTYPSLKWSHFYSAINWDDAAECLQWAEDVQAGVAEMKAWRRAQRGEDLNAPPLEESLDDVAPEPASISERVPFDHESTFSVSANKFNSDEPEPQLVSTRSANGSEPYAPYNSDAVTPTREREDRPALNAEQIARKLATTIERCSVLFTKEFCREFADLPDKVRLRLLKAIEQFTDKAEKLS
jgi:hypothetical protein